MKHFLILLVFLLAPNLVMADSWVFRPSQFSHNAQGERVSQYALKRPAYVRIDSTYRQSGYRYYRSVDGINRQYIVETWGPYYVRMR